MIPVSRSIRTITLLTCVAFGLSGCGGGGADLPATVKVEGNIKLNGKPCPAGANVILVPVAGGRPATGVTDAQGHFVLSTFGDKDGAVVGDHYVGVTLAETTGGSTAPVDDYNTGIAPGQENKVKTKFVVPEKFANPEQSGIQVTVPAEGTTALDFSLDS